MARVLSVILTYCPLPHSSPPWWYSDLFSVPIDTKTNQTRLTFICKEEAIHIWLKFIQLPATFIDGIRYLQNNVPKYSTKSIVKLLWNYNPFETSNITLYYQMMLM